MARQQLTDSTGRAHPRRCGADAFPPGKRGHRGGAHPRRCGADSPTRRIFHLPRGSSPQVRGRSVVPGFNGTTSGLIPAGAGQIPVRWRHTTHGSAHPRRCGADFSVLLFRFVVMGSSPQVRGRSQGLTPRGKRARLIPAGAGQIRYDYGNPVAARAHPRRCGADKNGAFKDSFTNGSSPQVRGRLA